MQRNSSSWLFGTLCLGMLSAAGCGQGERPTDADGGGAKAATTSNHDGWWCGEHGVPEEECGRCSTKAAAAFKAKGDWCKEHARPESQCFICHPEREAEFAALYEARYGTRPRKLKATETTGEPQS